MKAKCYTDPTWRYKRAVETDLRKTFQRIRREQAESEKVAENSKVRLIKKVAK